MNHAAVSVSTDIDVDLSLLSDVRYQVHGQLHVVKTAHTALIAAVVKVVDSLSFVINLRDKSAPVSSRLARITPAMHSCYRLMTRAGRAGTRLHRLRRLFQQLVGDMGAQVETNRLSFLRQNQDKLRAETDKGLPDAVSHNDTLANVGKKIILLSSFVGCDRYMQQLFQDAMAIVRVCGKPHLFITMTCNPDWPEIVAEVKATGGTVLDRPDVVARVFRLKLKALEADLYKDGVFGKCIAHLRVVEFQKRGLPHAHILVILEKDAAPHSPDDWGSFVQAELPDREAHPVLNALLSKNHKHGPCKQKPCGKTLKPDGRCSKHFPKPWREADTLGPNGSPEYKRRDAAHGGNDMNSMLVAYNWVLSWRYRCHLNVEICSSISSVKYLYKYVCKGHDRVAAVVQSVAGDDDVDEIRNLLDARYLGASEAVYRIFKFDLSDKFLLWSGWRCTYLMNSKFILILVMSKLLSVLFLRSPPSVRQAHCLVHGKPTAA